MVEDKGSNYNNSKNSNSKKTAGVVARGKGLLWRRVGGLGNGELIVCVWVERGRKERGGVC